MSTNPTVSNKTGASQVRTNAQAAQKCALGIQGKCSFCERMGYPILPLRYAVNPIFLKNRASAAFTKRGNLGKGVTDKKIGGHTYTLRTLRSGYLHVYLGKADKWQIYAVTASGHFRLIANRDDPDHQRDRELSANCKSDGHNIPASFINIPPEYEASTIWLAFAVHPWTAKTRAAYEKAPASRMQSSSVSSLAAGADAVDHALALNESSAADLPQWVDEYARDAADAAQRRRYTTQETVDKNNDGTLNDGVNEWSGAHGFYTRTGEANAISQHAVQYRDARLKKGLKCSPAAVVLHDHAGIVQEINHTRLTTVKWRAAYAGNPEVARRRLVSQSIRGVRKIYEHSAMTKAFSEMGYVIVDKKDAATQAKHPGKKLVQADQAEEAAKTAEYVYYLPGGGSMMGTVMPTPITTTVSKQTESETKAAWRDMLNFYDEGARATFDTQYEKTCARFQNDLNTYGADYDAWASPSDWMQWFKDYDANTEAGRINSILMSSPCLRGGPTDPATFALWKKWLEKKPMEADNPVYIALFGQTKNVIDYLTPDGAPFDAPPDKSDKLYDTLKGLATSEKGEALVARVAADTGLTTAIAHMQLALSGAVSSLGNELSAAAQATALRAQQAALHVYAKIEVTFVKLTMTLGQYLDALKAAGVEAAKAADEARQALSKALEDVTTQGGRKVRALMLAGVMSINDPALRNIVINVTLWTSERARNIARMLDSVRAEAQRLGSKALSGLNAAAIGAVGHLKIAGITVSRQASHGIATLATGMRITAAETTVLARRLMGATARIGGASGALILAAGAAMFQSWSLLDGLREMQKKVGAEKHEAWLSVVSAAVGVAAAGAELLGIALKALNSVGWRVLLGAGAALAAIASLVDAVQAFAAAARTGSSGDRNAMWLYLGAGVVFLGATAAGVGVLFAGLSGGFAALTLAGPLGWAIGLVALGVVLLFAAMWAEDTTLQIWCVFQPIVDGISG